MLNLLDTGLAPPVDASYCITLYYREVLARMTGFRVTLSSHATVLGNKIIFNRKNLLIKPPTYCCTVKVLIWRYFLSLSYFYTECSWLTINLFFAYRNADSLGKLVTRRKQFRARFLVKVFVSRRNMFNPLRSE